VRLRLGVALLYMGKGSALKPTVCKDKMTYEVGRRRGLHVREDLSRLAERDGRVLLSLSTRFKDSVLKTAVMLWSQLECMDS